MNNDLAVGDAVSLEWHTRLRGFWMLLAVVQTGLLLWAGWRFFSGAEQTYPQQHLRGAFIALTGLLVALSFLLTRVAVRTLVAVAALACGGVSLWLGR